MAKTAHSCKTYLSALELDLPPVVLSGSSHHRVMKAAAADDDGKNKPSVAGSMIVTPSPDLDQGLFRDVQNSCLLAQLAANKKVSGLQNDPVGWYKAYKDVLENIGWRITDFGFNKSEMSSKSFTAKKAIIGFLKTLVPGAELTKIQTAIDALSKAVNGDALEVFKKTSKKEEHALFQIGTAKPANGTVSFQSGAFYFPTSSSSGTVGFFFDWSVSDMQIYQADQTMDLNLEVYKEARDAIVKKLGPHAKTYVANIEI